MSRLVATEETGYLDGGDVSEQPATHDDGVDIEGGGSFRISHAQLLQHCLPGLRITPDCPHGCRCRTSILHNIKRSSKKMLYNGEWLLSKKLIGRPLYRKPSKNCTCLDVIYHSDL